MKQLLALFLALTLCLSLVACGENNAPVVQTVPTGGQMANNNASTQETSNKTTEVTDLKDILCCSTFWNYINKSYNTAFNEDGTTISPDGTWELDGSTVTCVWADGTTDIFEMKCVNGVYYLLGDCYTLVHPDADMDEIPVRSVEITLDNWAEYFEFGSGSREEIDQFGEPTGEIRTSHFLKLKDEHYRYLLESDSQVLFRYTINGVTHDDGIDDSFSDANITQCYYGFRCAAVGETDVFEMVKVQGTLYFVDGL